MLASTKRGSGSCAGCGQSYPTRWKPATCSKCGGHLGGKNEAGSKKKKRSCPLAVLLLETGNENIFSVQSSSRDDRCFVVIEGTTALCTHKDCLVARATYVSSGRTCDFKCKHVERTQDAVLPQRACHITHADIESYNGDSSSKEMLTQVLNANPGLVNAFQVTDVSYVVLGLASTNNTLGYVHVKMGAEGSFVCSSKDTQCKSFFSVKYQRTRKFCVHLHMLLCLGLVPESSSLSPVSEGTSADASVASSTITSPPETVQEHPAPSSNQRLATITLNRTRRLPYEFPYHILRSIDERNARGDWPTLLAPSISACELCGTELGKEVKHPGTDGEAVLVTSAFPFRKIAVRVKFCKKSDCKAMHQAFPYDIGLFNVGDQLLVSFDVLLEWREQLKFGHPISNVIAAKLSSLNLKLNESERLPAAKLDYLVSRLYHGFYCFEVITDRSIDDVICGVCGIVGKVYLGDGNEKNCCSNNSIVFPKDGEAGKDMLSLEAFIDRLRSHFVENCTYSKNCSPLEIHAGEIPSVIPPASRGPVLYNTEMEKKSYHLKSNETPEGDSYKLLFLVKANEVNMAELENLDLQSLKTVAKKCGIKVYQKSVAKLRADIHALYATILVGLCPCHGYNRTPGKTGGFYHFVCRHGTTVASKFLTLVESVRDPADIYLSLKYPPPVFISDSPCGFARHMECRVPQVTEILWGENSGCFEKPEFGKCPNTDVDVPELVTQEYRDGSTDVPQASELEEFQHPVTMKQRRYVLGDRFHSMSNPHKSPLCVYHDIEKCRQGITIKTSFQEMENSRKNQRRLRSVCAQSFSTHFFFNYLMDFYQNESVVRRQRSKLECLLKNGETVERDEYKRFVIVRKN